MWKAIGWKYEEARATNYLGLIYSDKNEVLEAKESLAKSIELFSSLGATYDLAQASGDLKELETREILSLPRFSDEKSNAVFDYLVKAFIQDFIVNQFPLDRCGWRTLSNIEKEAKVPAHELYGRSGGIGSVPRHLLQSKLVESAIFTGQRGRGGDITRLRLAYSTNSEAKEYVDRELRNKSEMIS
jgi:hypothetical protein